MDTFSALGDPTRRNIIEMLAGSGQLSAKTIYKHFSSSPPAISQHLKVLRDSELVVVEKKAQQRLYQINPEKLDELESWIKQMKKLWTGRFNQLDALMAQEQQFTKNK